MPGAAGPITLAFLSTSPGPRPLSVHLKFYIYSAEIAAPLRVILIPVFHTRNAITDILPETQRKELISLCRAPMLPHRPPVSLHRMEWFMMFYLPFFLPYFTNISLPVWKKHSLQMNIFVFLISIWKIYIWNLNNYVPISVIFKQQHTNWQPEKLMQVKRTNTPFLLLFLKWQCQLP